MPADPIRGAQQAINDGGMALRQVVPGCVREIIESESWNGRRDKHGNHFPDFPSFVEHEQWEGLGIRYTDLIRFCSDQPDVQRMLEGAYGEASGYQPGPGRGKTSDNVKPLDGDTDPAGNSHSYTMRRLKRDAPELFEQVASGELSAHAAAQQAGFRRKTVQVSDANAERAARSIASRFGIAFAKSLGHALLDLKPEGHG